jgi:hypothetical protein
MSSTDHSGIEHLLIDFAFNAMPLPGDTRSPTKVKTLHRTMNVAVAGAATCPELVCKPEVTNLQPK